MRITAASISPAYSVRQLLVSHAFNDPVKREHIRKFLFARRRKERCRSSITTIRELEENRE
jgi:hypothetical protein